MFKKKRFQRDNWMDRRSRGQQKKEQRVFVITMGVALIVAALAFSTLGSATSLRLPFRAATTSAP